MEGNYTHDRREMPLNSEEIPISQRPCENPSPSEARAAYPGEQNECNSPGRPRHRDTSRNSLTTSGRTATITLLFSNQPVCTPARTGSAAHTRRFSGF
jgi:hypothetical protein